LAGTVSFGIDSFYAWIQDKATHVKRIIDIKEQDKLAPYHDMGHISRSVMMRKL
jgi:hypothetical protein